MNIQNLSATFNSPFINKLRKSVLLSQCERRLPSLQSDSVELSKKIESIQMTNSTITFVIGSSYGLSDEVKGKANMRLSMSPMTFPHQLARVMLVEQLYRCFCISNNITYHK